MYAYGMRGEIDKVESNITLAVKAALLVDFIVYRAGVRLL